MRWIRVKHHGIGELIGVNDAGEPLYKFRWYIGPVPQEYIQVASDERREVLMSPKAEELNPIDAFIVHNELGVLQFIPYRSI